MACNPASPPASRLDLSRQAPAAIRLEARQAPLAQILKQLADETGVKIHYSILPSKPVTATCVGASVKTVIECLLRPRVDLAFRIPRNSAKAAPTRSQVAELWLLPTLVDVDPADSANAAAAAVQAQPVQPRVERIESAEKDRAQLDETLEQAASKDPEQRATALYNMGLMGNHDDPDVKDALRQALTDENANVREQAAASISQIVDPDLIAALNQQSKTGIDAVRTTDENTLSQDVALLQKAARKWRWILSRIGCPIARLNNKAG